MEYTDDISGKAKIYDAMVAVFDLEALGYPSGFDDDQITALASRVIQAFAALEHSHRVRNLKNITKYGQASKISTREIWLLNSLTSEMASLSLVAATIQHGNHISTWALLRQNQYTHDFVIATGESARISLIEVKACHCGFL